MVAVVKGTASDLGRGSDNTVIAQGQGAAHIVNQIAAFRLDNKPVNFKSRTLVSIKDGDMVAAAGAMKNGTLEALAVRNLTTGAFYSHGLIGPIILTVLMALVGLISLSVYVGYVALAIAAFVGWRIWTVYQAGVAVKAA